MYTFRLWFVLLITVLDSVDSYGYYREAIPNGESVPHPCKSNYIWKGVGHRLVEGGKSRNPFGMDFAAAEHKWTAELCNKDSDGDGITNGQELGDPDCVWSKDQIPSRTVNLSHPGVCEPWTDFKCKDQLNWVASTCEFEKFTCPGINDVEVKQKEIRFPITPVPSNETSYICMEFDLDTSDDFHLIATEALVNNSNVMHHAVLFGCASDDHDIKDTPHQCGMVASDECQQIMSIWVLGSAGQCFHDKVGFRIGNQGIKRVALQFHWNNPTLRNDYVDSSGMILYYTAKKRENDAGVLTIGAQYLHIPPFTTRVEDTSECPGSCTKHFITDKVYVVSAFNHMHYLGRSQQIQVFRNGTKIIDITNDVEYNYDSPVIHNQENPIELLPGDTLSTTCTFSSKNKAATTYFGDATSDEMCFGFITYYPRQNVMLDFCTSWKSLAFCHIAEYPEENPFKGCNFTTFGTLKDDENFKFTQIIPSCGNSSQVCSSECKSYVDTMFAHPCMVNNDLRDYFYTRWNYDPVGRELVQLLTTCYLQTTESPTTTDVNSSNGIHQMRILILIFVMFSIKLSC
ncbi:hypothetical protein LOTGIDRAFT_237776 [Lottia gigantea]|uniref:DOMON domain-containing protein n=1 Tax=Lottia gigantea TaxID=225164 RepID=V4AZT4_LOTGI|nr:hypothetical protein LOTGIDRAFT_237776 [Lottia gigantea]ESP03248.1 hypothetical protein LOTGIDRAFT_237776 [Lottia gigantea]